MTKRFYNNASVKGGEGGWTVHLDGKPVHTPSRAALLLPSSSLAEAVAAEWNAQGEKIDPATMPLTRLANTAIDRVKTREGAVADDIASYAASDLLCYRADTPEGLVTMQKQHWDPALAAMEEETGAKFLVVTGVVHQDQPEKALAAVRKAFAAYDAFALAALHTATTLTGSAILALLHARGRMRAEDTWSAAHVDEDWQISQWGEDAEAAARRKERWGEMAAASVVLAAADN